MVPERRTAGRSHARARARRLGFTLIELLVVLAILSALAVVALRATSGLQDRSAFEATQRTLEAVRAAVLGADGALPGDPPRPGFLADLGRLPIPGADPDRELVELWQQPAGVASSHIATSANDPEVKLAAGWRGPYLQLPLTPISSSAPLLLDGYANPLRLASDGTSANAPTQWVARSLGRDRIVGGGNAYDADTELVLVDVAAPSSVDWTHAELNGTVTISATLPAGSERLVVCAYVPDSSNGQLAQIVGTRVMLTPGRTSYTYAFSGRAALTPGTRAVRAYVLAGKADAALPADLAADPHPKSRVLDVQLLRGAQTLDFGIDG